MPGKIQREIKQGRPLRLTSEAYFNILRTAEFLRRIFTDTLRPHDLTMSQYNVLRILRGARDRREPGLTGNEIAGRMVHADPDMTRLLGNLAGRRLISRRRSSADGRAVVAAITRGGLALLARLEDAANASTHLPLAHLDEARLRQLIAVLEGIRAD